MKDLFVPCTVGRLRLRNRICRSATNDYAGNPDGTVSDMQMQIYQQLAENDVGLIITGHACVCPEGRNDPRQNGMYDDRFIPSQQALTALVHRHGGTIVQQLNHSGGLCPPDVIGGTPAAPSPLAYQPGIQADALSKTEISGPKKPAMTAYKYIARMAICFLNLSTRKPMNAWMNMAAMPKTVSGLCGKPS